MESLEEEAEAGPGFEAPAGCRGGGYPQTSPRSPPRPPPAASAARPGAGSRGRAGSPGRPAAAAAPSKRPFSLQQRLVEPPGPARRRRRRRTGRQKPGTCAPRRADAVELEKLLAGVKSEKKKKKVAGGGRGGSREGASRNSFLRQQLGCLRNPHNAWENGARTRLRSANPTEAQSAGCRAASFSPLSLGFLNPAQDTRQAVVSRHC